MNSIISRIFVGLIPFIGASHVLGSSELLVRETTLVLADGTVAVDRSDLEYLTHIIDPDLIHVIEGQQKVLPGLTIKNFWWLQALDYFFDQSKETLEFPLWYVRERIPDDYYELILQACSLGIGSLMELGKHLNKGVLFYYSTESLGKLLTAQQRLSFQFVDIDEVNKEGRTALHEASRNGEIAKVTLLLAAKANPYVQDGKNYTPLMYATHGKHHDVIELLQAAELPAQVHDTRTSLRFSSEQQETERLELADGFVELDALKFQRFKNIIDPALEELLEASGSLALPELSIKYFWWLLALDVFFWNGYGYDKSLARLLERRPDDYYELLRQANYVGLDYLVAIGKLLNEETLFWGSENELRRLLLAQEEISIYLDDLEVPCEVGLLSAGMTALQVASHSGDVAKVTLLLEAGADPRGKGKCAALILATHGEHREIVALLLAAGAATEEEDGYGRTALMYAVWEGRDDIVALLVQANAQPNVIDRDGRVLFHEAIILGKMAIVELLIKNVDLYLKDTAGRTALTLAVDMTQQNTSKERESIVTLLRNYRDTPHKF